MTHQPADAAQYRIKIERELGALRDAGRLAVHMNEKPKPRARFSSQTWEHFGTKPEELLAKLLQPKVDGKWNLPLLSMSLLPVAGKSIMPYESTGFPNAGSPYGYLVDVSQDKPHPPRVIGAELAGLCSGDDVLKKTFWGITSGFLPDSLRAQYESEEQWIKDFSTDAKARELSTSLLDRLAGFYKGTVNIHSPHVHSDDDMHIWNEILVAAGREHILGIVFPVGGAIELGENVLYQQRARLVAALAGLEHLKHGIDLPVMLYYSGDGRTARNGGIAYLGKGRQELLAIAMRALGVLDNAGPEKKFYISDDLRVMAKEIVGIDPGLPLIEQVSVMRDLNRELRAGGYLDGGIT